MKGTESCLSIYFQYMLRNSIEVRRGNMQNVNPHQDLEKGRQLVVRQSLICRGGGGRRRCGSQGPLRRMAEGVAVQQGVKDPDGQAAAPSGGVGGAVLEGLRGSAERMTLGVLILLFKISTICTCLKPDPICFAKRVPKTSLIPRIPEGQRRYRAKELYLERDL